MFKRNMQQGEVKVAINQPEKVSNDLKKRSKLIQIVNRSEDG